MKRNVVLVGHGYWGRNVARNLHQLGCLWGVCDANPAVEQSVREAYPAARFYTDFADVIADDDVEAVAITTQAWTHSYLALEALAAGRDLFVEKPMALSYERGEAMVEAAERYGRILMVGHLLEYHPAVVKLSELVQEGALGKLQYLYSNRLNLGRFRREENILWSFAPHDIAVILALTGETPIEVMAMGGAYLQANVADTTVTGLLFDNGVRAHVFVSWLHPYKEQRLVIVGSEKMAVFDDRAPAEHKLSVYDKGATWVNNVPVPREGEGYPIEFSGEEPLRAEMQHFIDCVEHRRTPRTDGASGLRVLRVLQAAQQSLQMGGSRLPLWQALQTRADAEGGGPTLPQSFIDDRQARISA